MDKLVLVIGGLVGLFVGAVLLENHMDRRFERQQRGRALDLHYNSMAFRQQQQQDMWAAHGPHVTTYTHSTQANPTQFYNASNGNNASYSNPWQQ